MSRWQPPHPAKTITPKNENIRDLPEPRPWRAGCVWPDCRRIERWAPEIPLCTHHARIVYWSYDKRCYPDNQTRTVNLDVREANVAAREAAIAEGRVAAKRKRAAERPGTVYYILVGAHIKIGYTTNMYSRMRAYPPDSTVLGTEPGTKETEKERHQHFEAHRALGREWFKDVPEIREYIAENCEPWSPLALPAAGPSGPRRAKIRLKYRDTISGWRVA